MGVPLRPWVATPSWVGAFPPLSLKVTLALILGCISQRHSYVPGLKGSEADAVEFSTAPCGLGFVGSALPLLALWRVLESYVGRGYNTRHKP